MPSREKRHRGKIASPPPSRLSIWIWPLWACPSFREGGGPTATRRSCPPTRRRGRGTRPTWRGRRGPSSTRRGEGELSRRPPNHLRRRPLPSSSTGEGRERGPPSGRTPTLRSTFPPPAPRLPRTPTRRSRGGGGSAHVAIPPRTSPSSAVDSGGFGPSFSTERRPRRDDARAQFAAPSTRCARTRTVSRTRGETPPCRRRRNYSLGRNPSGTTPPGPESHS
mmetsp:Transcript_25437/g.74900  ORF Transcript_25437/g.74900 Transcript_25437/m.74900 type:complete len:222 (+) Transcript_25437:880-1545(+)